MSKLAVQIRNAQTNDAEQLVRLHYDAVHVNAKGDYPVEILNSWSPEPGEQRFSWMRMQIGSGKNSVLVAEASDGTVGGFCIFSRTDGVIHALYVSPNKSRNGIGRQLLRNAEALMEERGISQVKLKASKNALGFYISEKYVVFRSTTQELADGTKMDCFEMLKDLSLAA